jgi:hypothetical protein
MTLMGNRPQIQLDDVKGRLIVNAAFRRIIYYNLYIPPGGGNYDQARKADFVSQIKGTQLYPELPINVFATV